MQGKTRQRRKLSSFYLSPEQIPPNLPCSVTLQPGPEDTGKVGHSKKTISLVPDSHVSRVLVFSPWSHGHLEPPFLLKLPRSDIPWTVSPLRQGCRCRLALPPPPVICPRSFESLLLALVLIAQGRQILRPSLWLRVGPSCLIWRWDGYRSTVGLSDIWRK